GDRLDDGERRDLPAAGSREDALRRRRSQAVVAGELAGRGGRGRLLELAAAAVRRVVRVARADRQVGDLAGRARRAPVELAADDDPEADPRADPQEDEALDAAADAARPLAQGGQVHVVVERDLGAELGGDRLEQALLAAGQIGAELEVG